MKPSSDLMNIFNQFANAEINGAIRRFIGKGPKKLVVPDSNDATLKQLTRLFKQQGMNLRVLVAGQSATDDMKPNRVNVHLERQGMEKFRIANFTLG